MDLGVFSTLLLITIGLQVEGVTASELHGNITDPAKQAINEFLINQFDECRQLYRNQDSRTLAPWTAAIFLKSQSRSNSSSFLYYTSGILISPKLVLTIAAGVYGAKPKGSSSKSGYRVLRVENVIIKFASRSTQFEERDEFTKYSEVSYILPYTDPPEDDLGQFHIILYHLKYPVNFTSYARPICMGYLLHQSGIRVFELPAYQSGFVKFKSPSSTSIAELYHNFKVRNATFLGKEECNSIQRYYYKSSSDSVLCGKLSNEDENELFDCYLHGSTIFSTFPSDENDINLHFFLGIVALIPGQRRGKCGQSGLYLYSLNSKSLEWLKRNSQCSRKSDSYACGDGSCIPFHKVCNSVPDCSDNSDEEEIFCTATNPCGSFSSGKFHKCGKKGECIETRKVCDGKQDCEDNSDESVTVCNLSSRRSSVNNRQSVKCVHPNVSAGVEVLCKDPDANNIVVDCQNAYLNSQAVLSCNQFYSARYNSKSLTLTCEANGKWSGQLPFACDLDCGIIEKNIGQLIAHGNNATDEVSFPWHAAIFKYFKGIYTFVCSATLIERSFLATAAHCVSSISTSPLEAEKYKIVLSPVSSNYIRNTKNEDSQIFNIKEIWLPPSYESRKLNSDIALIQTTCEVDFNKHIRPVCYFVPSRSNLPDPGTIGKVPGFGFNEENVTPNMLNYFDFPVVSKKECGETLGISVSTFPQDTFCIGYTNGTALCRGDSGGGFVVADRIGNTDRYVLQGIVSGGQGKFLASGLGCVQNTFTVMTHLDGYSEWMIGILEKNS